jgi:succinate dehydrogenase / fumarate reductase, flavoprotein subunit
LMVTSEAVARSALLREESRGGHTRLDFEGERDEWVKVNIVIRKGKDGEMEVEKVERSAPVQYLSEIANAKIEDLESGKVGGDAPDGSEIDLDAAFSSSGERPKEIAHA